MPGRPAKGPTLHLAQLCGKMRDDGMREAAFRGGGPACQNLSRSAIRHERDQQRRPASSA